MIELKNDNEVKLNKHFIAAEEIFNFIQTDLVPEDVMLLDAHDTIFIWIGNYSTAEERKLSMQTAKDYLRTGNVLFLFDQ